MWCSACQQDVPGLGSAGSGLLRCGKCGTALEATADPARATSGAVAAEARSLDRLLREAGLKNDDWELEADLRGVERLVRALHASTPAIEPAAVHRTHAAAPGWHAASEPPKQPSEPQRSEPPRGSAAAWLILSLGLATFACGAVLLGWSLAAGRQDLWPIGMPLALIGQAGLIVGLVLQLDGLWQTSRQTSAALTDLDGELSRVRQATTLLASSHSSSAQSFYSHLAAGASPQLLLTDLKGQLDLLAQQMASQRG